MRWRAFAGWVLVGALGGLTAIAIFSIGIFVAPFFVLAGVFVARHTRYPLDVLGLVVGLGIPCLAVALANRDPHPCAADSFNSCGGFDAHPWVAAGLTLVAIGAAAYVALRLAGILFPCRRAAK